VRTLLCWGRRRERGVGAELENDVELGRRIPGLDLGLGLGGGLRRGDRGVERIEVASNSGANSSIQASTARSGTNCWTRPRATKVSVPAPSGTGVKSTISRPLPRNPT
jgi:hypothetical protein